MALHTFNVSFLDAEDKEIVTIKADKYDEHGQPVDGFAVIEAGKRYIKERIGYSGNVKVRVR